MLLLSRFWLPTTARSQPLLNFCAFCQCESILHIDAKITDRALDLRVSKEDLDSAEISRRLVDDRCLCSPQRMGAVILAGQADPYDPFVNQTCILSSAYMRCMIRSAWKCIILQRAPA